MSSPLPPPAYGSRGGPGSAASSGVSSGIPLTYSADTTEQSLPAAPTTPASSPQPSRDNPRRRTARLAPSQMSPYTFQRSERALAGEDIASIKVSLNGCSGSPAPSQ